MHSKRAFWFCCLVLTGTMLSFPRWTKNAGESTFGWDVGGYYWYLPSVFIYHDLRNQAFADSTIRWYQTSSTFDYTIRSDNGAHIIKYSAGMAVMYSPAFFTAHLLARPLGYPADGFSRPYQVAVQLWSLLVAMIGLWVLRKVLSRYYTDGVVALTLLLLTIGTNYLNYASVDGPFSHNYLFTLYALLLMAADRFYDKPGIRPALAIGGLCGLMILTRPTEACAVILPVLWRMDSLSVRAIRERLRFLFRRWKLLFAAMGLAGAIAAVQGVYWKVIGGHWLIYSYGDQGFYWTRPHVWDYALSYRSGWITYTPVFFLGLAAIVPFLRYGRNRVALFLFSIVSFYIVSAWDMWWYAGTGGRAMVQYYPVWMFFFASGLTTLHRSRAGRVIAGAAIVLAVYMNIWMVYQQHWGGLYDAESMNRGYYWRVAGRWSANRESQKLKDSRFLWEGPVSGPVLHRDPLRRGADSALVVDNRLPGSTYRSAVPLPLLGAGSWLRATAEFATPQKEWTIWAMLQFTLRLKKAGRVVGESGVRVHRFLNDGEKGKVWVDIRLEEARPDSLEISFWYPGKADKPVLVRDLEVVVLDGKLP